MLAGRWCCRLEALLHADWVFFMIVVIIILA